MVLPGRIEYPSGRMFPVVWVFKAGRHAAMKFVEEDESTVYWDLDYIRARRAVGAVGIPADAVGMIVGGFSTDKEVQDIAAHIHAALRKAAVKGA